MDNKLLMKLFQTPSMSSYEHDMIDVVCDELDRLSIDYEIDSLGNIFNINLKGAPLLSAHLDTVQVIDDTKMADFVRMKEGYIKGNGVIGGDDKCGVYIILYLLGQGDEFNFVFSVQEEIGGQGISQFTLDNDISHIPYGLVLDRRGHEDIICTNNEYGIEEFEDVLLEFGKIFGMKKATGTWSDADVLSDYISCANISVGYHRAHEKDEYVNLEHLQKSTDFVHHVLKNLDQKFDKPEKRPYQYGSHALSEKVCDICNRDAWKTYRIESAFDITVCDECLRAIQWEVNDIVSTENKKVADEFDEYWGEYLG